MSSLTVEFSNPNFTRAQPDLLFFIRRQKAGANTATSGGGGGDINALSGPSGSGPIDASTSTSHSGAGPSTSSALHLPSLLTDLSAIRKHQTAISADLKDLQQSNQLLWQEALASREKHRKQEETINKILRFLAGVFGGQVLDGNGNMRGTSGSGDSPVGASPGADSVGNESVTSEGGEGPSKNNKGKGKERMVVPKARSRLLLEDVKGRQQERAAALRELDGSEEEEEEIEEIPSQNQEDDHFATISSCESLCSA